MHLQDQHTDQDHLLLDTEQEERFTVATERDAESDRASIASDTFSTQSTHNMLTRSMRRRLTMNVVAEEDALTETHETAQTSQETVTSSTHSEQVVEETVLVASEQAADVDNASDDVDFLNVSTHVFESAQHVSTRTRVARFTRHVFSSTVQRSTRLVHTVFTSALLTVVFLATFMSSSITSAATTVLRATQQLFMRTGTGVRD